MTEDTAEEGAKVAEEIVAVVAEIEEATEVGARLAEEKKEAAILAEEINNFI